MSQYELRNTFETSNIKKKLIFKILNSFSTLFFKNFILLWFLITWSFIKIKFRKIYFTSIFFK